jgi:tetratricopeptide (TPR) repeat protein
MTGKAFVFILLLLCILGCHAGSVTPQLSNPEFQAQNQPIRTLRILAITDGTFRENEIETFVLKCSGLMETQAGIRVEITERQQIKWGREFNDASMMLSRMAADTWEKRDSFDLAVAFAYYKVIQVDKRQLGAIDSVFHRYVIIRELDPNVLLHELFHSFLLVHSEEGAMKPDLPPYGNQWYWLTPEERTQVLQNKWRDFNVVPAVGNEKNRKLREYGLYCYIGMAYFEKKEYIDALILFDKALEVSSEHAEGYLGRGAVCIRLRKYDQAISDFDKAIELNPNSAAAYYSRGYTYYMKGQYDTAISDYTKALEINPGYKEVYIDRGAAYDKKGQGDAAISDYTKAIGIDSGSVAAYSARGNAYRQKGQYDAAISDYSKVIRIDPTHTRAHYGRGMAYSEKGKHDAAISDYTKAIEIDPGYVAVYNARGIVYRQKGQYDAAIADYSKAIELDSRYSTAYYNRGNTHRDRHQYDRASADYYKAIEINPKYAAAYNNLAWLLATVKEPGFRDGTKALEFALKACELSNWKNPSHLDTLAAAYARTGDFENAIKWQEKSLEFVERSKRAEIQQRLDLYREHKPYPPD